MTDSNPIKDTDTWWQKVMMVLLVPYALFVWLRRGGGTFDGRR